ncbi:MAG: hypothetical protein NTZ42_02755 [Candidatus Gribaldobacteria bacterium]|nr:hypothetical protein [Candidatus Gribaldobacteria bacterium]
MRASIKFFAVIVAIALLGLCGCGAFRQIGNGASAVANAIGWCFRNWITLLVIAALIFLAAPYAIYRLPWWATLILAVVVLLWLAGQSGIVGKIFSGIVAAIGEMLSLAGGLLLLAIALFGLWVMTGRLGRRH